MLVVGKFLSMSKKIKFSNLTTLLIFILIFYIVSYFTNNGKSFLTKQIILSNDPAYVKTSKGVEYLELRFINEYYERYSIGGDEYENLNHKKFIENIHFKDTLSVVVRSNSIYSLKKQNVEYIKFDKKYLNDKRSNLITIIVITVLTILSLFLKLWYSKLLPTGD